MNHCVFIYLVHDDDLVAEDLGLVQVVRGQQDGAVAFQLHYHVPDLSGIQIIRLMTSQ